MRGRCYKPQSGLWQNNNSFKDHRESENRQDITNEVQLGKYELIYQGEIILKQIPAGRS